MSLAMKVNINDLFDKDATAKLITPKEGLQLNLEAVFLEHNTEIRKMLTDFGAVSFRGFNIELSPAAFKSAMGKLFPNILSYMNQTSPRVQLENQVYTATEYPADQVIQMHNENAYCNNWPKNLAFFCIIPPATGGETPLADSRKVFARIPEKIRSEFINKKIMYTRTCGIPGIDLPWQKVYQTESKSDVENYLTKNGIKYEWGDGDILRIKEICNACLQHPVTDEWVWFNQAHLFHISSRAEDIREYMMLTLGKENLPRNAYFGDGSDIPDEYIKIINAAFEEEKKKRSWQAGDITLVDNLLYSHGRESFTGDRKVLVIMGD